MVAPPSKPVYRKRFNTTEECSNPLVQQAVQQAGVIAELDDRIFNAFGAAWQVLKAVFLSLRGLLRDTPARRSNSTKLMSSREKGVSLKLLYFFYGLFYT